MKNIKIKKEIMEKIRKKEVKMRPRWQFLLEEVEIKVGIVIMLGLVAVGLSMVVIFWQIYNPVDLAQFGEVGWQLMKEDFPYIWLGLAVLLGVIGIFVERKDGQNYKIQKRWLALISVGVVVVLTVIVVWLRQLFKI